MRPLVTNLAKAVQNQRSLRIERASQRQHQQQAACDTARKQSLESQQTSTELGVLEDNPDKGYPESATAATIAVAPWEQLGEGRLRDSYVRLDGLRSNRP